MTGQLGWDERRGWAYLVWVGHLSRRPSDHASHPCDACRIARMLGLGPTDEERLLAAGKAAAEPGSSSSADRSNVVPLRAPGGTTPSVTSALD